MNHIKIVAGPISAPSVVESIPLLLILISILALIGGAIYLYIRLLQGIKNTKNFKKKYPIAHLLFVSSNACMVLGFLFLIGQGSWLVIILGVVLLALSKLMVVAKK